MLKKIRNSAHHYVFKALFILLAFIFVIGLGDFSQKNPNIVATIGNHEIFLSDFVQATNGQIDQNTNKSQKEMINYEVITKLVTQSLIKQEAESLGIKIDPEIIVEYIKNDHNFYNNGVFDIENYKKTLEYNNLSEDKLLGIVSNQIASRFLLDSLVASLPLKSTLGDYLYNYLSEKRSVSLITVDMSKKNLINFSEQDLKNYYQKHQDSFKSEESRSFSYLFFNPKEIQKKIEITEEAMLKEYEENKEEYSLAETRDFYHFLAPSQEIANQIAASLKNNQDQEKVAKEFINKKVIAEVFKNQPEQSFLSSLDLSLFNLLENEITKPIKSELGWHVFKILKIHHRQYKSFADSKKEIRENLQYKISEIEINELLKNIEDEVASGAEFNEIAKRNNIHADKKIKISMSEANHKNNINQEILKLAFELSEKEESEITMLDKDQGYAIVRVDEVFPEVPQNFEEARSEVKTKYLAELKDNIALEITKALQVRLSEDLQKFFLEKNNQIRINTKLINEILEPIYNKYKIASIDWAVIDLKTLDIVRPAIGDNNLPPSFVSDLFQLDPKKASLPEKLDYAKYGIAIVEDIISANKLDKNMHGQIARISEINYKNEIYDQYINYLKEKYKVEINFHLINNYQNQQ